MKPYFENGSRYRCALFPSGFSRPERLLQASPGLVTKARSSLIQNKERSDLACTVTDGEDGRLP
ncbi:hypothetical protein [Laceyella putida]|uniref:Uncharacterized protein n=1 Tax=Laceyella putida TaxID=110101 RepID=A0ABW2RJT7_9BACL